MSQRSAFQLQILEKLATPLMQSVTRYVTVKAGKKGGDAEAQQSQAGHIAELVSKCVQLSIGLSKDLDLKGNEADADAVRLSLATVCSPLVGEYFSANGKAPTDPEINKMVTALQAALTFSDKFAPTAENISRVAASDIAMIPGIPSDEAQANIQYVQAMVPVVNAVQSFSFGQPEAKLTQEIATHLTTRAETLRKAILPAGVDEFLVKQADLRLLRMAADLYAACHREETLRIMGMDQAERAKLTEGNNGLIPMDTVWKTFDARVKMLETLSAEAAGVTPAQAAAPQPQQPPQQAQQPQQAAPQTPPPAEPQQAEPPQQAPQQPVPPQEAVQPPPQPPAAPPTETPAAPPQEPQPQDQPPQESSGGGSPFQSFVKTPDNGQAGDAGASAAAPQEPQSPPAEPQQPQTPPPQQPPQEQVPPQQPAPQEQPQAPQQPEVPPAQPPEVPPAQPPEQPQTPPPQETPPPEQPPQETPPPSDGGNPMSFFASKKSQDDDEK